MLYGRPGEGQVKRMQTVVTRIQSISTWQQRLEVLGVKPEGEPDLDVFMTQILRGAWQRSLAKGYHKQVSSSQFSFKCSKACLLQIVLFRMIAALWSMIKYDCF